MNDRLVFKSATVADLLAEGFERMFKHEQDQPWRAHVEQVAEKLTARV